MKIRIYPTRNPAPAKYTPGPWERHSHAYADTIQSAGGSAVCTLLDGLDKTANARLIAAAPELLAAARLAVAWAEQVPAPYRDWPHIVAARAAIAKATGGAA